LRTATAGLGLLGAGLLLMGGYGQVTGTGPLPAPGPAAVLGLALLGIGVALGPRRAQRSRYRPAPFGARSLACLLCGLAPLLAFALEPTGVHWTPWPLGWPPVPPLCVLGIIVALAPVGLHADMVGREVSAREAAVA
jgi:energy-coupling factor transport system permease protein